MKNNKKCPYCGKLVDADQNSFRPFCSDRCKTMDLGNWAMEKYRVASTIVDDNEINNEEEAGEK